MLKLKLYGSLLALVAAGSYHGPANAATVVIDGTIVTSLSQAVTLAQTAGDSPHTINIMTDTIVNDVQVSITQPMVINGNADGDDTKCDVLVDVAAIKLAPAVSLPGAVEKAYITVQTSGTVQINDLNIHPNTDGVDETDVVGDRVDGIRLMKPNTVEEAGNYILTRVNVSGSDANNNYIALDTGADLYASAAKKWSSGKGVDSVNNAHTAHAVVQVANGPGAGTFSATLDHCHIGLGKSAAINIPTEGSGRREILGGVYGHCGTDGIRVSGNNTDIRGTRDDRVRVLRSTNITGGNAHCIEIDSNGRIGTMEYVDIAGMNSANLLKLNDGNGNDFSRISTLRFVRGLGKFNDGSNAGLYLNTDSRLPDMADCTFVGPATNNNPVQTALSFKGNLIVKDTIFTSVNLGQLILDNSAGTDLSFTNCALPVDGVAGESLSISGAIGGGTRAVEPTLTNNIAVSPQYLLTLEDYDWSDAQGTGDPNNGPGNNNVLRPSNTAYGTASSTGGALNGGAGPSNAGIDANVWMLM